MTTLFDDFINTEINIHQGIYKIFVAMSALLVPCQFGDDEIFYGSVRTSLARVPFLGKNWPNPFGTLSPLERFPPSASHRIIPASGDAEACELGRAADDEKEAEEPVEPGVALRAKDNACECARDGFACSSLRLNPLLLYKCAPLLPLPLPLPLLCVNKLDRRT